MSMSLEKGKIGWTRHIIVNSDFPRQKYIYTSRMKHTASGLVLYLNQVHQIASFDNSPFQNLSLRLT